MAPPRILAFAGSLRADSLNKHLARTIARGATNAGAEVTLIDLANFRVPVYDGDLEATAGLPESAANLRALIGSHDGLIIACPEYNGSVPGALKNLIDWTTRSDAGQPDPSVYAGRVATLAAASPGGLGGLRGLVHLRSILTALQTVVLPAELCIRSAHTAFDDSGEMTDERQRSRAEKIGADLVGFISGTAN